MDHTKSIYADEPCGDAVIFLSKKRFLYIRGRISSEYTALVHSAIGGNDFEARVAAAACALTTHGFRSLRPLALVTVRDGINHVLSGGLFRIALFFWFLNLSRMFPLNY